MNDALTTPHNRDREQVDIPATVDRPEVVRPPGSGGSPRTTKSTQLAVELQEAVAEPGIGRQSPSRQQDQPPLDYNRRPIGNNRRRSTPVMSSPPYYETTLDRDVFFQPALLQVLRRATGKIVHVCRFGVLPERDEKDWSGWLSRKSNRGDLKQPEGGRAKSIKSVVLMTIDQYKWMQRARFVNETVDKLTLALSGISGNAPESMTVQSNLISTESTVSAFSDQIARMGTASNDPDQAALDDRALLYLQQMLVDQGLKIAPSPETQVKQLVHPEMTRRATRFLVKMYKLRKAVSKATNAKRLANHDAILLQASVILDEYLMTREQVSSAYSDGGGGTSEGDYRSTRGSVMLAASDTHRKRNLVQHVLGDHLIDLCKEKQTLTLQVEANYTKRTNNWGWCCPEVVLAGAQIQVNFLIDMTKHTESTGTQYAGMFLVNGKPQRISTMEDYYESFNILADRSLWEATRENIDTPVAAAASVQTDPGMVGESTTLHERTASPTFIRKKRVIRTTQSDDETEKKKLGSTHSTLSMESASGSRKGTRTKTTQRATSAGAGDGMNHSRRASPDRSSGDGMKKPGHSSRDASEERLPRASRRPPPERIKPKRRVATDPSGHESKSAQRKPQNSQETTKGTKQRRKPSLEVALANTNKSDETTLKKDTSSSKNRRKGSDNKRRKSGDTAPSFHEDLEEEGQEVIYEEVIVDDDDEEETVEILEDIPEEDYIEVTEGSENVEVKLMTSEIIPEIEKMGKLGAEVADILRSPSKHAPETRSRGSKASRLDEESTMDGSIVSSDSNPITLRPKAPPLADASVGGDASVVVFQPPGDKIPSMSMRASEFNQPATPTTAAYTTSTASTTLTTVGGSSAGSTTYKASSSESYEQSKAPPRSPVKSPATALRKPVPESKRSKSAPAGRPNADPPAFRAPSQREQMERQKKEKEKLQKGSTRSSKKSDKKDAV